ncbi:MAG: hypothetical protein EPN41_06520 [Candidimonas sp.]|nr:MAG: hypothetical protein EPN41_06520 [Candidimonas sp.]
MAPLLMFEITGNAWNVLKSLKIAGMRSTCDIDMLNYIPAWLAVVNSDKRHLHTQDMKRYVERPPIRFAPAVATGHARGTVGTTRHELAAQKATGWHRPHVASANDSAGRNGVLLR